MKQYLFIFGCGVSKMNVLSIAWWTSFSQRYSPMQMIELLNEVYTIVDSQIEQYDVYKVETIGDTFMVASGMT